LGIETKSSTIDGVKYTVTQFPARKGFQLKVRIARLLAPALKSLLGSFDIGNLTKLTNVDINPGMVGQAFGALFESSDPDDILRLVMELLRDTRREGQEIDDGVFDVAFAANYAHLYKVVAFVVSVNYSNLLREVAGLANTISRPGEGAGAVSTERTSSE
jgi:hypothetical protein